MTGVLHHMPSKLTLTYPSGPARLLGFDDRTMMYEGDAKDWEAQVHWHGDQLRR
jgi:hypothetical protein